MFGYVTRKRRYAKLKESGIDLNPHHYESKVTPNKKEEGKKLILSIQQGEI